MPPSGYGKKKRSEGAGPRFYFCRWDRLKDFPDFRYAVLTGEPPPMGKVPVVYEVHDDGLLVLVEIKILKTVRPKKRPKRIGQARVRLIELISGSHRIRPAFTGIYSIEKLQLFATGSFLAPFPRLCYKTGNRPSCNRDGGNPVSRRNGSHSRGDSWQGTSLRVELVTPLAGFVSARSAEERSGL